LKLHIRPIRIGVRGALGLAKRGIATMLTASMLLAADGPVAAVQVLLEKARAQEGRGRLDLANQTWRHVLLADRNNAEALAGLARAAKNAGRSDEAKGYLDRLRAINPKHEAIAKIESMQTQRVSPNRLAQAGTLASQQRFTEAMEIYREVLGDEPPPGSLAVAYYETLAATSTGWEPATAGLAKLVAHYPESLDYQFALARLYTYRPKTRSEGIRILLAIPAESPFAAKARPAVRQALLWDGANPANAAHVRAYLARQNDPELEALLAKTPKVESASKPAQTTHSPAEQAGYDALKGNKLSHAAEQFESALQTSPTSVAALTGLGYVRMQEKRFRDAEELFERARTIAPDNKEIVETLKAARFWALMTDGTRAMQTKRMADAQKTYEEALKLRPAYPHALRGLSGSLMAQSKFDEAIPVLAELTEAEPASVDAWRETVRAHFQAKGSEAAFAILERISPKVTTQLADDADHQALLAAIYNASGRSAEAMRAMDRLTQVAAKKGKQLSPATMLQFAGIHLSQNQASKAADLYGQVVDREPSNVIAWEGLMASLASLRDDKRAAAALKRMPKDVYQIAMARPGFVSAAAIIETNSGHLEQAEKLLLQTLERQGDKPELATQFQLASVWIKQNRIEKAEPYLRELTKQHPDEMEAWKLLVQTLQNDHRSGEAILLSQRIPAETRLRLFNDSDFIALMAAVHSGEGDDEEALRLVRSSEKRLAQQQKQPSADLLLQHGWLALKTGSEDREVYAALTALQQLSSLTEEHQKNANNLWSVWTRKRADRAREAGDLTRAVALLEAGRKALPEDRELRSSLAGTLMAAGMHRRSLAIYKSFGLKDAEPVDYMAAIGAAMLEDPQQAEVWMRDALGKWPANPDVLNLAGKHASQRGDYKQAQMYWRSALGYMGQRATTPFSENALTPSAGITARAGARLGVAFSPVMAGGETSRRNEEYSTLRALDPDHEGRLAAPVSALAIAPVAPVSGGSAAATSIGPVYESRVKRNDLERQIAAVEARNASFSNMGGNVDSRSGRDGFDKRVLKEAELEVSHAINNSMRVALVAKPTSIDAGIVDGTTDLRFGLLPRGASFGRQQASGIAAEVQASTNTFGISAGVTPQGFAVQNFVGGIRFRPGNGPIQIKLAREAVKDTLLSYAGTSDPVTNQKWGGVISTGGTVMANVGNDVKGWYLGGGYDLITGKNVADNRRLDATAGFYRKVYGTEENRLTLGANVFTMRYEKNLRYFTVGHGGYFSPQTYYLLNMPFAWTGRYQNRFLYSVSGAIGMQKFREDAAAYFPTLTAVQGRTGPYYAASSNTGINYSLQASLLYQIAPHWYAGGFFSMNNTRNYNTQAVGMTVKYLFQARPLISDQQLMSIPNWLGQQPFQPK
jgi:tetratricopeptide (TPR) repeat protein